MKAGAYVLHLQHIYHKIGELVSPFFQPLYLVHLRCIFKKLGVIIPYKTNAGCAGRYYIISARAIEVFDEFGTYLAGIVPEAGIVSGLSATGLIGIISNS